MLDLDKSVHLAVQGKSGDFTWVFRIKFDDPGELVFLDTALDKQIWVSSATKYQLELYKNPSAWVCFRSHIMDAGCLQVFTLLTLNNKHQQLSYYQ